MTTYASINDLHSDRQTDADRADVRAVQVAGWQECHHVVLATALGSAHGVHQVIDPANPGKAGVAISWRKDTATLIAKGLAVGHLAVEGMMGRFLAWAVLEIDDRLHLVISGHRPPLRLKHLWPTFDANVDALIDRLRAEHAPDVVVVLLDANQAPPTPLITRTGLSWHGVGIDGALVADATVTNLRQLPFGDSDHRPVVMTVIAKETPMFRLPADLPARLRAAGLTVVELPGWQTRGRPASTGGFAPVGVLWHHTGGTPDSRAYVEWMTYEGRDDLPAPLAQIAISRTGVVYVCAAGRANHAGTAKASGSVAAGDGNELYVGVECMNTGSEGWDPPQYDAMVATGQVLGDVLDCTPQAQRGHRETSVTGKWDPGGLNLDKFRTDLSTPSRIEEDDMQPADLMAYQVPFTSTPDKVGDRQDFLKSFVEIHTRTLKLEQSVKAIDLKLDQILAALKA